MRKLIPKFIGTIEKGKLTMSEQDIFDLYISSLEGEIEVVVKKRNKTRTAQQNKALHLYFTQLAEILNEAGWDMKKTLKADWDILWTMENIKNNLWRPIQEAYICKKSTTELTTTEIDKIYDILNKGIGEKTGIYIPFPSIDNFIYE